MTKKQTIRLSQLITELGVPLEGFQARFDSEGVSFGERLLPSTRISVGLALTVRDWFAGVVRQVPRSGLVVVIADVDSLWEFAQRLALAESELMGYPKEWELDSRAFTSLLTPMKDARQAASPACGDTLFVPVVRASSQSVFRSWGSNGLWESPALAAALPSGPRDSKAAAISAASAGAVERLTTRWLGSDPNTRVLLISPRFAERRLSDTQTSTDEVQADHDRRTHFLHFSGDANVTRVLPIDPIHPHDWPSVIDGSGLRDMIYKPVSTIDLSSEVRQGLDCFGEVTRSLASAIVSEERWVSEYAVGGSGARTALHEQVQARRRCMLVAACETLGFACEAALAYGLLDFKVRNAWAHGQWDTQPNAALWGPFQRAFENAAAAVAAALRLPHSTNEDVVEEDGYGNVRIYKRHLPHRTNADVVARQSLFEVLRHLCRGELLKIRIDRFMRQGEESQDSEVLLAIHEADGAARKFFGECPGAAQRCWEFQPYLPIISLAEFESTLSLRSNTHPKSRANVARSIHVCQAIARESIRGVDDLPVSKHSAVSTVPAVGGEIAKGLAACRAEARANVIQAWCVARRSPECATPFEVFLRPFPEAGHDFWLCDQSVRDRLSDAELNGMESRYRALAGAIAVVSQCLIAQSELSPANCTASQKSELTRLLSLLAESQCAVRTGLEELRSIPRAMQSCSAQNAVFEWLRTQVAKDRFAIHLPHMRRTDRVAQPRLHELLIEIERARIDLLLPTNQGLD